MTFVTSRLGHAYVLCAHFRGGVVNLSTAGLVCELLSCPVDVTLLAALFFMRVILSGGVWSDRHASWLAKCGSFCFGNCLCGNAGL